MSITNRAILTFNSNVGEIVRLSIPRANPAKTAETARAAMEAIIDGGIVMTGNGTPMSIHGAELHSTIREIVYSTADF